MRTSREIEKKSSAVTLSDMEVFIFPNLMYSLLLANLMSPRIWKWLDDPWFDGVHDMKPYKRIQRLKQYIMDHYQFNLDLDTWGLTTKKNELARFGALVDPDTLAQSNALFGYEGDKYYFDIDIRTHFGLDKYGGETIPYWKTETVEAMDAFCFRPGYPTGAGECVSLAALYSAALFIVARVPLKDIYLMATPLHSQNFVDVDEGILTNNRRLVTRTMWFNGSALSAQARRALENERVTIVAHETGHIHAVYEEATIDPAVYTHFAERLRGYLRIQLNEEILGNFLRHRVDIQQCFQMRQAIHGVDHYIGIERVVAYEAGGSYRMTDGTRPRLMNEIDTEEFSPVPLKSRIVLNDLEAFVREERTDIDDPEDIARLKTQFATDCLNAEFALETLIRFCRIHPHLPDAETKRFASIQEPLNIDLQMSREDIVARLEAIRDRNDTAHLAFYAYRDLNRVEPQPFLMAAVERCPVSIQAAAGIEDDALAAHVDAMPSESIYDGPGRLAQPDEVWNFGRGDGVEKALLLTNIWRARHPESPVELHVGPDRAVLTLDGREHEFSSTKGLREQRWMFPFPEASDTEG